MVNHTTIQTAFAGLIGFENSKDPQYANLKTTLTTSSSGRKWNHFHPLITVENIHAIAPAFDGMTYNGWIPGSYSIGDIKLYQNKSWISLVNTNTSTPGSDSTKWELLLNSYLESKINASISNLVSKVLSMSSINGKYQNLLERKPLFNGVSRIGNVIVPKSRRVGLEIKLKHSENIRAIIDYIGAMFSQAQTGLTIDLHHSSQKDRIGYVTFTGNGVNSFKWVIPTSPATGWNLDYVNYLSNYDSGGAWYISYLEDNVIGNAIQKEYDWSVGPCCNSEDLNLFNLWNKYFNVSAFAVASGNYSGSDMWDVSKNGYSIDTNYGLNIVVTIQPELTEIFTQRKNIFVDALGKQFAFDMIMEFLHNPSSRLNNKIVTFDKTDLIYELDGNRETNKRGLKYELDQSIDVLTKDLSNISITSGYKANRVTYGAY